MIEIEGEVFYDHARAFPLLTVVTCDSTHVELPANAYIVDVCTVSCVTVNLKLKIYKYITWPCSGPFRAFAGSVKVSSFPHGSSASFGGSCAYLNKYMTYHRLKMFYTYIHLVTEYCVQYLEN